MQVFGRILFGHVQVNFCCGWHQVPGCSLFAGKCAEGWDHANEIELRFVSFRQVFHQRKNSVVNGFVIQWHEDMLQAEGIRLLLPV